MVGVVGSNPIAPIPFGRTRYRPERYRIELIIIGEVALCTGCWPLSRFFMTTITLPDGSEKTFEQPLTVMEIAASIGPGLAKAAIAGEVDGRLVDACVTIDADASLRIITGKTRKA